MKTQQQQMMMKKRTKEDSAVEGQASPAVVVEGHVVEVGREEARCRRVSSSAGHEGCRSSRKFQPVPHADQVALTVASSERCCFRSLGQRACRHATVTAAAHPLGTASWEFDVLAAVVRDP